jgi:uncharacterized protein YdhG (YjbR/CyaY superfamily)
VDAYIDAQAEDVRPYLIQVRDTIRSVLPNAEERISWSMPTYWQKKNIIHFAAFKKHIGLYPGEEAVAFFLERLSEYKTSKGTIQFPYNKPIPFALIAEIEDWCLRTSQGSVPNFVSSP